MIIKVKLTNSLKFSVPFVVFLGQTVFHNVPKVLKANPGLVEPYPRDCEKILRPHGSVNPIILVSCQMGHKLVACNMRG